MITFNSYLQTPPDLDILYCDVMLEFTEYLTGNNLQEKSRRGKILPQEWGEVDKSLGRTKQELQAHSIYKDAYEKAIQSRKTLSSKLKLVTKGISNPKILVGIKGEEQFVGKILDRGKSAKGITDILRAAILVKNKSEYDNVVKRFRKEFVVVEDEFKGLDKVNKITFSGENDRYGNVVSKSGDSEYGYHGSHHFLVNINGLITEVQVMTKKLWAFKEVAHNIYGKYRGVSDFDSKTKKLDLELSKQLFKIGNR